MSEHLEPFGASPWRAAVIVACWMVVLVVGIWSAGGFR